MSSRWNLEWPQLRQKDCTEAEGALADPIEREEWRGLDWLLPALSRWSGSAPHQRTKALRKAERESGSVPKAMTDRKARVMAVNIGMAP